MTPVEFRLRKKLLSLINQFNEALLEHDRFLGEAPSKVITEAFGTYHQETFEIWKTRKFLDILEAKIELEKAQKELEHFLALEEEAKKRLAENEVNHIQ